MNRRRDLLITNGAALLLLLVLLIIGWTREAAIGLAVLVVLDAIVLIRERAWPGQHENPDENSPTHRDQEP